MGSPRKQAGTQQQGAHQQQKQQREKMCGPPCFRSVCGMPLQKAVYIIGLICSVLLFIGARMRHRCLLIFWILITLGCSIKYLYVFFVSDWTSLEDWVSISYLVFYTAVTL